MTALIRNRRGEGGPVPHRSGRLRCVEGYWFIARRGPALEGPYPSQEAAEAALEDLPRRV